MSNRIKELRELNYWTQKELAIRAQISDQSLVAEYERGAKEPDSKTLKRLAFVFHCSVSYLLGEDKQCSYCQDGEFLIVTNRLKQPSGGGIYIYGNQLRYEDYVQTLAETINYCPMCGRKLGGENDG